MKTPRGTAGGANLAMKWIGDYIESYPNPCDTLRERPSRSRTLQGIPI